jgi:porphobilinogen synthase
MSFKRFHEFRSSEEVRDKHADVTLSVKDLIYPLFVVEGNKIKKEIDNLSDVYHMSVDVLLEELKVVSKLGIDKILLFGVVPVELKTMDAQAAWTNDSLVMKAIHEIKKLFPEIIIITDVCLCGYTNHGHCGIIMNEKIDNDATLPFLSRMAMNHALAGADFVAPSAMMDGQVQAIADGLKTIPGNKTKILGYSAKFASGFYGPFRNAAGSAPAFGDRKSYQMDYRATNQAIQEIQADIDEGADLVMVKPALAYLDIIAKAKMHFPYMPMVAYHVSGEYMMIKAAAKQGILDENNALLEATFAIKRSGADFIITYFAKVIAQHLIN